LRVGNKKYYIGFLKSDLPLVATFSYTYIFFNIKHLDIERQTWNQNFR